MAYKSITDDLNLESLRSLLVPETLMDDLPLKEDDARVILQTRNDIADIIHGRDDRLLVIVGPCSIHDPLAAIEYAHRLKAAAKEHQSTLLLVMRVYFEKPRTIMGWKGLINDPDINGSFDINRGLEIARKLLLELAELGMPAGCEILDMISPQFFTDLLSWAAVGARTTESQTHREMASGLSVPVGFKNGTDGNTKIAVDAINAASYPHHFLTITKKGNSAIAATKGNSNGHIILRGSDRGPNYDQESVAAAVGLLSASDLPPRLMIDCSHGNSGKDYTRQPLVAAEVAAQISRGSEEIFGVMLESNLFEGRQSEPDAYGVSITDGCISWETTVAILEDLAGAVGARRIL